MLKAVLGELRLNDELADQAEADIEPSHLCRRQREQRTFSRSLLCEAVGNAKPELMTLHFQSDSNPDAGEGIAGPVQDSLGDLARELVDKVGIEGAVRYCHSLGWRGVLAQVELLRQSH